MKKKLMILGGSRYILPVIKAAHKLGLYVITCDYLPNNIAHRYSDEYVNVSIIDMEAVLKIAKAMKIDGIMSFACDPGVVTAAYVAENMGLPSVGTYESVSILQNKWKFREFLAKNGFNVPLAKCFRSAEEAAGGLDGFTWPLIVKPTDSAGSKGVSRIDNEGELESAINNALLYSHKKEIIIEEFLEKEGCSSDSDSFSVDGNMVYFSFSSQMFDSNADNPYTPSAYYWPPTISEEHQLELKQEIQRLVTLLGLKTSVFNIETRECANGKAYIMEMSPRGGGNRLSEMVRLLSGVDLITNSIKAAVGLPIQAIVQSPITNNLAEIILHSDKTGLFDRLLIDETIKDDIVEEDLWVRHGDAIGSFTGANEAIGTVVLKFEDRNKMLAVLSDINKYIKVLLLPSDE